MGPFTSGGLDVTLKCGPNDELSMTTKIPAGADTFPVRAFQRPPCVRIPRALRLPICFTTHGGGRCLTSVESLECGAYPSKGSSRC
jgi:hypothetical protein